MIKDSHSNDLLHEQKSSKLLITKKVLSGEEDSFFVANLQALFRQHCKWRMMLPRVKPFYAVKCNSDSVLLKALDELGVNFDCASSGEIEMILQMGVAPERIIYANPCKQASHIRYAKNNGIDLMTFDNVQELHKIKGIFPEARVVLRILVNDAFSVCKFGTKFGASMESIPAILDCARSLNLDLVGVSFHVGSGCFNAIAFYEAVKLARVVFDEAKHYGFDLKLLDIGGGFPGFDSVAPEQGITFSAICAELNAAFDEFFDDPSIEIIAEPGRYFAASVFTLAVAVTSRRVVQTTPLVDSNSKGSRLSDDDLVPNSDSDSSEFGSETLMPIEEDTSVMQVEQVRQQEEESHLKNKALMYYINDGVYGSFNCILFDHAVVKPKVLTIKGNLIEDDDDDGNPRERNVMTTQTSYKCSMWGPTCDSMDCITKEAELPELDIGDWLYFENMGAYTLAAASPFNGFKLTQIHYLHNEAMISE